MSEGGREQYEAAGLESLLAAHVEFGGGVSWEAHLAEQIEPFIDTGKRAAWAEGWCAGVSRFTQQHLEPAANPYLIEATVECPANCERDHAPCSRNRWLDAAEYTPAEEPTP